MTLKKFLKMNIKENAQATLEYFILFAIIALLTIVSLSSFFPKVQTALQGDGTKKGFFQEAVGINGLNIANQ